MGRLKSAYFRILSRLGKEGSAPAPACRAESYSAPQRVLGPVSDDRILLRADILDERIYTHYHLPG